MVVDSAQRSLDGNAKGESSLPLPQRTNTPAEVAEVEGPPPRALTQAEAPAVAGPTLEGSPAVATDVVCDEGNGKDDATFLFADDAHSRLNPPSAGQHHMGARVLLTMRTADSTHQARDSTTWVRAIDGPAVVNRASNEGEFSAQPPLALTSREIAAPGGSEVQPALPTAPDGARAVEGPAVDAEPAAVVDRASGEGDDSAEPSLALTLRENAVGEAEGTEKSPRGDWSVWKGKGSAKYKKLRSLRSGARLLLHFAANNIVPSPKISAPVNVAGSITANSPNPLPRRSACVDTSKS